MTDFCFPWAGQDAALAKVKPANPVLDRNHPHARGLFFYALSSRNKHGGEELYELVQKQRSITTGTKGGIWYRKEPTDTFESNREWFASFPNASATSSFKFPVYSYKFGGLSKFTISFWVRLRSYGGSNQGRIFDTGGGVSANGISLKSDNSGGAGRSHALILQVKNTQVGNIDFFFSTSYRDVWVYASVVYEHNRIQLYRNGKKFAEQAHGVGVPNNETVNNLTIGNRSDLIRNFDGWLENIRAWKRVVGPQEQWEHYAQPYASVQLVGPAFIWRQEVAGPEPIISSVEPVGAWVADGQVNCAVIGSNFEAIQGTGAVSITDGSTSQNATVTSWSDTRIEFTAVTTGVALGAVNLFVTNNNGQTNAVGFALDHVATIAATGPVSTQDLNARMNRNATDTLNPTNDSEFTRHVSGTAVGARLSIPTDIRGR